MASVIGAHLRVTQGQVRCFRPGLDYTLAIQNPTSASEKFSLNLCFVNDFGNDDEKSWSSGDVGGYLCHMKTKPFEKMSTPAEVYTEENEEKVSSVDATFNTLTIIKEDENIVNFIKYISKSAPSCRWDIISNATRSA
jgi:Oxoglutarate and iron-dependent oxygenase degradation C-term.|tara:strand:- start:459 stop:872 length:414 start_codon:yes stop_codon:yes gene_type:complete